MVSFTAGQVVLRLPVEASLPGPCLPPLARVLLVWSTEELQGTSAQPHIPPAHWVAVALFSADVRITAVFGLLDCGIRHSKEPGEGASVWRVREFPPFRADQPAWQRAQDPGRRAGKQPGGELMLLPLEVMWVWPG